MASSQIKTLLCCLLLATTTAMADEAPTIPQPTPTFDRTALQNHMLYLMHSGDLVRALEEYRSYTKQVGCHDVDVLERIGLVLLDQGYRTKDPEVQVLTLFGAAISMNEKALYIIEEAMSNEQPQIQLMALNFLAKYHNNRADQIMHRALTSNIVLIRFEAALHLAAMKDQKAVGQTEALMVKVPEQAWCLFPQIYGLIGTPEAKKILRKMSSHKDEMVRIATILSISENGHDDMLPIIRRLASHHEPAQQEACAIALGVLHDETSVPRLRELAKSKADTVSLAALVSLYQLGHKDAKEQIEAMAMKGSIFAIYQLGKIPGSEPVLAKILQSTNPHIKTNAAIALLERRDIRCALPLVELVLRGPKDLALMQVESPGKSMNCYRVVPSAQQNFKDTPALAELSLHNKEDLLAKVVELPEDIFLKIADVIFETQQNELIPALIAIMENHPTPKTIDLLKKHQQKAGAPLVRNYCNLALYRLKQEGPYGDYLIAWVSQQQNVDLIRFRPLLTVEERETNTAQYELTPQETSRLLVEAFETFASTQDDKAIDLLISVIQQGNAKNKYALIGLLMRAIQ